MERIRGVGVGGTTAEKFIGQTIDKVADRSNVRDLYLTTHNRQVIHAPVWDSNPQSQQASSHRPTP